MQMTYSSTFRRSEGSRHGALFELLRHQAASEKVTDRLGDRGLDASEADQAQGFLSRALASWDLPAPSQEPEEEAAASAPKARRDHEFFRAVRA